MYKLKTNPWIHQWKALDYVMTHSQAALFTDMGSGKTKVMVDMVENRGFGLVLIVTTKKSCAVWEDQFKVHSEINPEFVYNVSEILSADKVAILKEKALRNKSRALRGVIIVNYDSVWREPFKDFLLSLNLDCVICDESHKMKSAGGKASMFLARLGKRVPYRYIMSGTPASEAPTDIYGQYRFLKPDIFGTNFGRFKDRYLNYDRQKMAFCGYPILVKSHPYLNMDEWADKIYSCAFYIEVNQDLPEITHRYVEQPISLKAQKIYKEFNKEGVYIDEDGVLETNNILAKMTGLQQILSGYLTLETENFTSIEKVQIDTTKADILEEILTNISYNERVVVFAKYRKDFDLIQSVCKKLRRSYGEISGQYDDYSKWKKGSINVVAVQYSSGAESIDLTESKYCVYYSHTHSYGQYLQSVKRIHRPGQKRPVIYYHIISTVKGVETVDEKIQKALEMKMSLVEYVKEKGSS